MKPDLFKRKNLRLKNYDYLQNNGYFVTICVDKFRCIFGDVIDGKMVLSEEGEIVKQCWYDLEKHYKNVVLNEFVIMPNHFHAILFINNEYDAVVEGFKPSILNNRNKVEGLKLSTTL